MRTPIQSNYFFKKSLKLGLIFVCVAGAPLTASIVKIPTGGIPQEYTYQELPCSEQDQAMIYEIISTVAENGKLTLLLKQSHLKFLGAQVNHVHPLKFLSVIFSHPFLKACMPELFNDYFKRAEFMGGLGPNLEREAEKGKLERYLTDFATDLSVNPEGIRPFFILRDWEGLVRYLMQS